MTPIDRIGFSLPEVDRAFGKGGTAARSAGGETSGPSFGEMVENSLRQTVETVRAGDRAAIAGLNGQIPLQDMVQATMEMETAMRTTVALRDKTLEAWQELLRMSV